MQNGRLCTPPPHLGIILAVSAITLHFMLLELVYIESMSFILSFIILISLTIRLRIKLSSVRGHDHNQNVLVNEMNEQNFSEIH